MSRDILGREWIDHDDGHAGGFPHWCVRLEERGEAWRVCTTHSNGEPGDARGLTAAYRCGHAAAFGLFDCAWVDAVVSRSTPNG